MWLVWAYSLQLTFILKFLSYKFGNIKVRDIMLKTMCDNSVWFQNKGEDMHINESVLANKERKY